MKAKAAIMCNTVRFCDICGLAFKANSGSQKYCSDDCRKKAKARAPHSGIMRKKERAEFIKARHARREEFLLYTSCKPDNASKVEWDYFNSRGQFVHVEWRGRRTLFWRP